MLPSIKIDYHRAPFLKGVSVSTTAYHDHQFPKHFHDHYTIQLIEEGINEGFTESTKYKVGQGGLLVINPGDLHAGNSLNEAFLKFHTVRLNQEFVNSFFEQNECGSRDTYFFTEPTYSNKLSQKIGSLIFNIRHEDQIGFESALTELLIAISKDKNRPKTRHKVSLKQAREYLHDHFHENLSLNQIAEVCHLSPYHFLRQFKKQFGLSPLQYLRNIRIEKAKTLLSKQSISQTAHQVGFYDHSHFLKHYKKIEGITPSKQLIY